MIRNSLLKIFLFISIVTLVVVAETNPCVCTREYNPVCGSDNIEYPTPCHLKCAANETPGLKLKNRGRCAADGV